MMKTLSFIGAFLLFGCAQVTVGRDFDTSKVGEIVKGKTSREEVLKLFGEPQEKDAQLGVERWIYVKRVTSAAPKSEWLRFAYRGDVQERKLLIIFDQGLVKDMVYSEASKPFGSSLGFN